MTRSHAMSDKPPWLVRIGFVLTGQIAEQWRDWAKGYVKSSAWMAVEVIKVVLPHLVFLPLLAVALRPSLLDVFTGSLSSEEFSELVLYLLILAAGGIPVAIWFLPKVFRQYRSYTLARLEGRPSPPLAFEVPSGWRGILGRFAVLTGVILLLVLAATSYWRGTVLGVPWWLQAAIFGSMAILMAGRVSRLFLRSFRRRPQR